MIKYSRFNLLLGLFFIFTVEAKATDYYVSPSGAGSTCSSGSPCTFDTALGLADDTLSGNHTIYFKDGTYTEAANDIHVVGKVFTGSLTIKPENQWGAIISGYATAVYINASRNITVTGGFKIRNCADGGVYISDSSSCTFSVATLKNVVSWGARYTPAINLSSEDGVTGTKDCLIEDVGIISSFRYGIMIGGTNAYSERNRVNRVLIRFEGSDSVEPKASMTTYGATTGILGARNCAIHNVIVIDGNAEDNASGEGYYGAFYSPHAATNIRYFGCIAMRQAAGRGFMLGEDSGSGPHQLINSLLWVIPGDPLFSANNSSITLRGNTFHSPSGEGFWDSDVTESGINNLFWRTQTPVGMNVDNFNGYFPSTGNTAGSSNENTNDPGLVYPSSIPPTSSHFKSGLYQQTIGASILWKVGCSSGMKYSDIGMDTECVGQSLWPWPYQDVIKDEADNADTGAWATDMPGNVENRGFAAPGMTVTKYIWEQLGNSEPIWVGSAGGGCAFTPIVSSFTTGGVTATSATITWTGVGAVNYQTVFDDSSNFSAPLISSGVISGATSGYMGLNEDVTYYFKVKVASEPDCGYTTVISTWFRFTAFTQLNAAFANVSTGSFNISWIDSTADHIGVLSTNNDFTNIFASGTITNATTFYYTLSHATQYWFEVKVATESGYNSSINTFTLDLPKSSPNSHRRGNNKLRGRFK